MLNLYFFTDSDHAVGAAKIQLPPEKAVAGKEFLQNQELKPLGSSWLLESVNARGRYLGG